MDINWHGNACVRIRTRQAALVMDPTDGSDGFDMGRPAADIVTVSRHHPQHDYIAGVRGEPIVIDGPGEYEIRGLQLYGLASPLSRTEGEHGEQAGLPERNTAFLVEAEGLHIAHLGGGCAAPGADGAELLSNVDILVVAIAGDEAVDPEAAARTVRNLEPKIVIPVSYPGPNGGEPAGVLAAFLAATGLTAGEPLPKLTIQARGLGEEQRVVLLEARRA
ncbi:MAG: MBL fold metallo-hydrolase [Chloroflexi bacterium]|nr:MBL fold metallo-hydrolase [Chloroflexota bacterium]